MRQGREAGQGTLRGGAEGQLSAFKSPKEPLQISDRIILAHWFVTGHKTRRRGSGRVGTDQTDHAMDPCLFT